MCVRVVSILVDSNHIVEMAFVRLKEPLTHVRCNISNVVGLRAV